MNCPAIPAALLESELFGHEKGAFTGAVAQKIGWLERLGSNRTIRVNIRFVAATNRGLKGMVEDGKFQSDLYYRLHVFPVEVPPLRDRKSDIPLLVKYFIRKYAQRMNRPTESISTAAIEALTEYEWPGNIRELQNLIERSVILTRGPILQVRAPEGGSAMRAMPARGSGLSSPRERDKILRALKEAKGVVGGPDGTAARLGLKRTTLQSRMKALNIGREYR